MIEPTDEMRRAFYDEDLGCDTPGCIDCFDDRLAAVLAIVQRDYDFRPATCDQPKSGEPDAYCELPRGHPGGHSATVTRAVDW